MKFPAALTLVILALTGGVRASPPSELPVYVCRKVPVPIKVDGRLDDAAWTRAHPVDLVVSSTGAPAARRTTARLCWDDRSLYIAYDAHDHDIWGTLVKHDDLVYLEEVVEVFLDTDSDLKRYYEINVSPRNTVYDAIINNSTGYSVDNPSAAWNCRGLRTAVHVEGTLDDRQDTDHGWTVEVAVPFASLSDAPNTPPKVGDRWKANLYRIDLTPTPELSAWSPTLVTPDRFHVPARFGTLVFADAGTPAPSAEPVR